MKCHWRPEGKFLALIRVIQPRDIGAFFFSQSKWTLQAHLRLIEKGMNSTHLSKQQKTGKDCTSAYFF
jgi:hypothetical protein